MYDKGKRFTPVAVAVSLVCCALSQNAYALFDIVKQCGYSGANPLIAASSDERARESDSWVEGIVKERADALCAQWGKRPAKASNIAYIKIYTDLVGTRASRSDPKPSKQLYRNTNDFGHLVFTKLGCEEPLYDIVKEGKFSADSTLPLIAASSDERARESDSWVEGIVKERADALCAQWGKRPADPKDIAYTKLYEDVVGVRGSRSNPNPTKQVYKLRQGYGHIVYTKLGCREPQAKGVPAAAATCLAPLAGALPLKLVTPIAAVFARTGAKGLAPVSLGVVPSEVRRYIQETVSDQDRQQFRDFIDATKDDREVVQQMKRYLPRLGELFKNPNKSWLKDTIESHTITVMKGASSQIRHYDLKKVQAPGVRVIPTLKVAIALHDIGKLPNKPSRDQHKYTKPILLHSLQQLGFNKEEIDFAYNIVENDIVGKVAMNRIDSVEGKRELQRLAGKMGMTTRDFLKVKLAFYVNDAGYYPDLKKHFFIQPNGKIVPNRNTSTGKSLNDLIRSIDPTLLSRIGETLHLARLGDYQIFRKDPFVYKAIFSNFTEHQGKLGADEVTGLRCA